MRKLILKSLVLALLATKAMADYSNTVMSLGPVAYWQLNETNQPPAPANLAPDKGTAGSDYDGYYGAASAVGFTGALVGDSDTAAHFSGASGGITVPYGPVLALKVPFTVEGWFNPDDGGDTQCAVAAGNFGATRSGWLIYKRTTGWDFRMYNQNGGSTSLDLSGGDVTTGIYHHVVAVYDGTNGYVYVDGALAAGPTAPSGFVPNADGPLTIGTRSDGGFGFPGYADEVALYTNALSASTVLAHYQNGTNTSPSQTYQSLILSANPVVYYRLGDTLDTPPPSTIMTTNYGSLGTDYNGTLLPGTYPGKSGPFGAGSHSVKFVPATGGYVDCTTGAGLDITGPMTVIGWFKGSPADDSRFQSFLGISDVSWRADASGGVAHWADGFDTDAIGVLPVNDGNWHFFAGVYDGATNFMYIDGALDGIAPSPTPHTGDGGAHSCVIGGVGDYLPGRLYQGSVAQVAVYSSALSASQIQSIYNSATLPPFVKTQPIDIAVNQGTTAAISVMAGGSPALSYQWYKTNTPVSGQTSNTLTLNNVQPGAAGSYRVVIANSYGSVTSSFAAITILQGPPVILQDIQPVLSTNFTGMPNTFSVVVGGTPPFAYQWKRDGIAIAGATGSSYTFGTAAGTHTYSVFITNAQGSATSRTNTVVERVSNLGTTFAVNFHDAMAAQYAATADDGNNNLWTNVTYQGLGAYEDGPANTNWNGFGFPDGFTPVFTPSVSPQLASDGSLIPITLTTTYGGDNGALYFYGDGTAGNTCATCPSLVLGYAAVVNGANPVGSFVLHNVPPGVYNLYLYGANYDNDRGASFTVNSGSPHNGLNGATNDFSGGPASSFVEGANYVYFTNVIRTVDGLITGTWGPVSNPFSGNSGEGDFNGLQLVKVATAPPILSIGVSAGIATMKWNPGVGVLQSATNVAGPYIDIPAAATPYIAPVSGHAVLSHPALTALLNYFAWHFEYLVGEDAVLSFSP